MIVKTWSHSVVHNQIVRRSKWRKHMMRLLKDLCHNCYTDSMNAKHALVPLFVRIPDNLMERLKRSAAGRGTSMAAEVAHVLEQGIEASFSLELKHQYDAVSSKLYKAHLEALENLVLRRTDKTDETEASQALRLLRSDILKLQKQRRQAARDLELQLKERQARLAESAKPPLGAFAALDPDYATSAPGRLSKSEWRRRNLQEVLAAQGDGAQSRLAESLKCTRGYVSQLLGDPGAKGHRSITPKTARKIETALHLQSGALDHVPPASEIEGLLHSVGELRKVLRGIKT